MIQEEKDLRKAFLDEIAERQKEIDALVKARVTRKELPYGATPDESGSGSDSDSSAEASMRDNPSEQESD